MAQHIQFGEYFPDRSPTWTEVLLVAMIVAFILVPEALGEVTMSWPAFVAGFLAFGIALGPAGATRAGKRVGEWFGAIGVEGRLAVIGAFAVAVIASRRIAVVPDELLADAAVGGLVMVVVYFLGHVALAGGVSGWRACCS